MPSEPTRAYAYRVVTAAAPLAAFYGLVSDEALPLWLAFVAAILGTGMAAANTPTSRAS